MKGAHRIPSTREPQGAPPRTFIFKLLHFHDRDLVMRETRSQGELHFKNATLLLFPDYSIAKRRQQKSFDLVRTILCTKSIKYSMLFLARLQVEDGGTVRLFTFPEEASAWIDTLSQRLILMSTFPFHML